MVDDSRMLVFSYLTIAHVASYIVLSCQTPPFLLRCLLVRRDIIYIHSTSCQEFVSFPETWHHCIRTLYWGIPSPDGIPLRGCRLFFFFSVFFRRHSGVSGATQREANTGFGWYFAETCILTLFSCCYKIFHMRPYFTELWAFFE